MGKKKIKHKNNKKRDDDVWFALFLIFSVSLLLLLFLIILEIVTPAVSLALATIVYFIWHIFSDEKKKK